MGISTLVEAEELGRDDADALYLDRFKLFAGLLKFLESRDSSFDRGAVQTEIIED